jgi:acetolactate synthase-1/2/3 large subunit
VPPIERLAYLAEMVTLQLAGLRHLVLVDAKAPVSFFAYPGKPSYLVPDGCQVHGLANGADDGPGALEALAEALGAGSQAAVAPAERPGRPTGELTAEKVCQALGALLPAGAVVSDEGNTAALLAPAFTAGSPRHDWLTLTGGAIGQGLPLATGAAVACPDRKVISFQADGSAMYTIQALWTQAREDLDVTTILLNNRAYSVLNMELGRVGAGKPGSRAKAQLDLSQPKLDFVLIAAGMGVPAVRPESAEEFTVALERALASPAHT